MIYPHLSICLLPVEEFFNSEEEADGAEPLPPWHLLREMSSFFFWQNTYLIIQLN